MGTLNAIYVRVTDARKAASLRSEYSEVYTEPGSEFHAVEWLNSEPPLDELASLSARLDTDVLWLAFQSVVDAFQFHHWRSGKHVRALVFGCYAEERTWDWVNGDAESWERAAIFEPALLAHELEYAEPNEVEELKRIWRQSEIVPDRRIPDINARETARKVAEFYHLPGWALDQDAQEN